MNRIIKWNRYVKEAKNLDFQPIFGLAYGVLSLASTHGTVSAALLHTLLILFLSVLPSSFAQPDNDLFQNATLLSGDLVNVDGTFLDASRESGEQSTNGADGGQISVWWKWQATRDGHALLTISNSMFIDWRLHKIKVFEGLSLNTLAFVAQTARTDTSTSASLQFPITASRTYYFAIIGPKSSSLFFDLRFRLLPPNDVPGTLITSESGEFAGDLNGATPDVEFSSDQRPAVSWDWVAPDDGQVVRRITEAEGVGLGFVYEVGSSPPRSVDENVISFRPGPDAPHQGFVWFLAERGKRYRLVFKPLLYEAGDFKWDLTFSRMRLVGPSEPGIFPFDQPVALSVENLPAIPNLQDILLISNTAVLTNRPGETNFLFRTTNGGRESLIAAARDTKGRYWTSAPLYIDFRRPSPSNDYFSAATPLKPFTAVSFRMESSTPEADEPDAVPHTLWYSWLADLTGRAGLRGGALNGTTQFRVYTGDSLTTLQSLTLQTNNTFLCVSGTRYYISLGSQIQTGLGSFELVADTFTAPNDNYVDRELLTGTDVHASGSFLFATSEGEFGPYDGLSFRTLWYGWTAPTNGELQINLRRKDKSPVPTVQFYAGTNLPRSPNIRPVPTTTIFTNTPAKTPAENTWGFVSAGTNIQIQLEGLLFPPMDKLQPFNFDLQFIPAPPNDLFSNRTVLTGDFAEILGTFQGARGETNGPYVTRTSSSFGSPNGSRTVWYQWTPPRAGKVAVSILTPLTANVFVFIGESLTSLTQVSTNTRPSSQEGSFYFQDAGFNAQRGTKYTFAFTFPEARPGMPFIARFAMAGPPNDNFTNRLQLPALRGHIFGSSGGATIEPGEPPRLTNSVWWSWTAPTSGWATLRADRSIRFEVFTGEVLSELANVPIIESSEVRISTDLPFYRWTGFNCVAGETYQIAVVNPRPRNFEFDFDLTTFRITSPPDLSYYSPGTVIEIIATPGDPAIDANLPGPFVLTRSPAATFISDPVSNDARFMRTNLFPGTETFWIVTTNSLGEPRVSSPLRLNVVPFNDDMTNASDLSTLDFGSGANVGTATFEPGESATNPAHTGSLWYRWSAPGKGEAEVGFGTFWGAEPTVYTGSSASNLSQVPAEVLTDPGTGSRALVFPVEAGQTYFLAIRGSSQGFWSFYDLNFAPLRLEIPRVSERLTGDTNFLVSIFLDPAEVRRVELHQSSWPIGSSSVYPFKIAVAPYWTAEPLFLRAKVITQDGSEFWSAGYHHLTWRAANDAFSDRIVLGSEADTTLHNSDNPFVGPNATLEPNEPDYGDTNFVRSLWWIWTAPADGLLRITADPQAPTRIGIFSGNDLPSLLPLVSPASDVRLIVTNGHSYQIAIATTALFSSFVPAELRFAPFLASSPPVHLAGTQIDFVTEFALHPESTPTNQLREFNWNAPGNGLLVLTPSFFNITGPFVAELFELGETNALRDVPDRDGGWAWEVENGNSYLLRITAPAEFVGTISWHLGYFPLLNNDQFADRVPFPESSGYTPVVFRNATSEPGESVDPFYSATVWFSWTPPITQRAQLWPGTITANVYTGSTLTNLHLVHQALAYQITNFLAEEGVTYHFGFVGHQNPENWLTLSRFELFPSAANDSIDSALELSGNSTSFVADNRLATRHFGEPYHAGLYGGRSLWWKWTAPASGSAILGSYPRTFSASPVTPHQLLAIYTAAESAALNPVASAALPNGGGNLPFEASRNVTYWIAFDGFHGAELESVLHLQLLSGDDIEIVSMQVRADQLEIRAQGSAAQTVILEHSENLATWTEATRTTLNAQGSQTITLPLPGVARGFFRLISQNE